MAAGPVLNFLSATAQAPLEAGEDLRSSEAKGFKKTKVTLSPDFLSSIEEYVVCVPKDTTHVGIMATSFSGSKMRMNGTKGNMSVVKIEDGSKISISLHESDENEAEALKTYHVQVKISEETAIADDKKTEVVMKEKEKFPGQEAHAHTHSHDGVPCMHDHGTTAHGHSHDGKDCNDKDCKHESHSHIHESKHGHSHDGKACCDKDFDKKEDNDHSHSHAH